MLYSGVAPLRGSGASLCLAIPDGLLEEGCAEVGGGFHLGGEGWQGGLEVFQP